MRSLSALAVFITAASARAQSQTTEMVPMSDTVLLATEVYLPAGAGPFHALLARTPYGRTGMGDLALIASYQGWAFVAQDMRGSGDSGGDATFFLEDASDGAETLSWIAAQTWSSGRVATYGPSALGITQYLLAPEGAAALRCQIPLVATPDLYGQAAYWGGALRESLVEGWLADTGATAALPLVTAHPTRDELWEPLDLAGRYGQVTVPAFHIGGWYDIFSQGTLDAFVGYESQGGTGAAGTQRLVMGPWSHTTLGGREVGEITFPASAQRTSLITEQVRFLRYCLADDDDGISTEPAVSYYVMGADEAGAPGNEWREADAWPPLSTEGLLHLRTYGQLTLALPRADEASVSFASDPADPVPSRCGNNLYGEDGPCDQAVAVESRSDVLTFTSYPLLADLEITGRVKLRLHVATDRPDADVSIRLTDAYPDGRSMLLLDGIRRLRARGADTEELDVVPGETYPLEVDLWSTSYIFPAGHRIRVSVSGSSSPRFRVNPHTGDAVTASSAPQVATTTLVLAAGAELVLPVVGDPIQITEPTPPADTDEPEPDGGCACATATPAWCLVLLAPLGRARRRRR